MDKNGAHFRRGKTIRRVDYRRDTGVCDYSMFANDLIGMLCNLTHVNYTYTLTSYPTIIVLVYLLYFVQLGPYIDAIGYQLELGSNIPQLSNRQHYYKGRWTYVEKSIETSEKSILR